MKTLVQKIHIEDHHAFACRNYRTPDFETNWHKHEEYELIVINAGHGTAMIGEYIGEFKAGDIYFITANLPHWFRKQHHKMIGDATVLHFKPSIFGEQFINMPELKLIKALLQRQIGIQLLRRLQQSISAAILQIVTAKGFQRVELLLQCLHKIGSSRDYAVCSQDFEPVNLLLNPAIEQIIIYSFKNYLNPITLPQIAAIADMSIPTFCRFFKKNIKKTYFDFLQDLRISHACKLLTNTDKPIMGICYESGYNSWAHFSKQFKKIKQATPSQYRAQFIKAE
ncbi:MAG: AraC family transcriptional regulator [Sphingobacteriia bacterium]|jgi:AraC-like DNA-binding protein|nr:MAG: AraC family transcriptional regulator [Sphingobacteriia bacterium]